MKDKVELKYVASKSEIFGPNYGYWELTINNDLLGQQVVTLGQHLQLLWLFLLHEKLVVKRVLRRLRSDIRVSLMPTVIGRVQLQKRLIVPGVMQISQLPGIGR